MFVSELFVSFYVLADLSSVLCILVPVAATGSFLGSYRAKQTRVAFLVLPPTEFCFQSSLLLLSLSY
jgi:hypothetical protein